MTTTRHLPRRRGRARALLAAPIAIAALLLGACAPESPSTPTNGADVLGRAGFTRATLDAMTALFDEVWPAALVPAG